MTKTVIKPKLELVQTSFGLNSSLLSCCLALDKMLVLKSQLNQFFVGQETVNHQGGPFQYQYTSGREHDIEDKIRQNRKGAGHVDVQGGSAYERIEEKETVIVEANK